MTSPRESKPGTGVLVGLAAVPIGLGALAAGAALLAEDQRMLVLSLTVPGAALTAGCLLAAAPVSVLLVRAARTRADRRAAAAVDAAVTAVSARERDNHQRFLARLDHELKNPVTAIRATAAAAPSNDEREAWRTVDAQASRLSTLVQDLRKLAELETRALELENVDLEDLLRDAVDALAQQHPLQAERVTLTVTRVPWPVPMLSLDHDLVALAVDNVLGNAIKYSSAGPIEVRLRKHDGWAVIEVADAGRGIPAQDLPGVFDELARAQNARDVSGSGIGLSLVAAVMRMHGGDVSLRSAEAAGTVVTLRLPVRD